MAEVACHLSSDSPWASFKWPDSLLGIVVSQCWSFCYLYCFSAAVFLTWIFQPTLEPSKWMYPLKQYRYLKDPLSCVCKYLNVRTVRICSTIIIREWQTENSISYREIDILFIKGGGASHSICIWKLVLFRKCRGFGSIVRITQGSINVFWNWFSFADGNSASISVNMWILKKTGVFI